MRWTIVSLLLLGAASGVAGEETPTPEAVADAVLRAVAGKERLEPLAAAQDPDPWLVADELWRRGERAAALAFARAAPRPDTEKLPAHLEGRTAASDEPLREALSRAEGLLAENRPEEALAVLPEAEAPCVLAVRVRLVRARARRAGRDLVAAQAEFEVAAKLAEGIGWRRQAALACSEAMVCAFGRGDARTALDLGRQCLRLEEERKDVFGQARCHSNLGGLHQTMGELPAAQEQIETALRLLDSLAGSSRDADSFRAVALVKLARVQRSLDHYAEAVATGERAVRVLEELGPRDHLAWALANLGETHCYTGLSREALPPLERALGLMREERDERGIAFCLAWIGSSHAGLGETERARRDLEEAVATARIAGARWVKAQARQALAKLTIATGSFVDALAQLEEADRLARAVDDSTSLVWILSETSRVLLGLGSSERAREVQEEAVALAAAIRHRPGLAEALCRVSGLLESLGEYDRALEAARRARAVAEEAGYEAGVASAWLAEGIDLFRLGRLGDSVEALERARRIRAALGHTAGVPEVMANLGLVLARRGDIAAAREALTTCVDQHRRQGNRTNEASALLNLAVVHDAAGAFARGLSARERALVLAEESRSEPLRAKALTDLAESLRRIGRVDRARALLEEALRIREDLGDRMGAARTRVVLGVALIVAGEAGRARELLAQARDDLESTKSADAATACLNLGMALRKLGRFDEALVEIERAAGSFRRNGLFVEALWADEDRADVLFDQRKTRESARLWARTGEDAETAAEARAVGDVVLLGAQATERRLREKLASRKRWRAVHLACHGLIDPERPTLSCLALAPDEDGDPFLTTYEILGMEIPADLVALSACETGTGRIYEAEGVVGLAQAFLHAGAPRVLCSLWDVDDEATRVLMTRFYDLWKDGHTSAGAALREAQEAVRSREAWRHPRYWAAWVLWGIGD